MPNEEKHSDVLYLIPVLFEIELILQWGTRQINTTAKRRSRDNLDACSDDDDSVDGQHSSDPDDSTTLHISRRLGRCTSSTSQISTFFLFKTALFCRFFLKR